MVLQECPSCCGRHLHYSFSKDGFRLVECDTCSLLMLNPQPSDHQLAEIYGEDYYLGDPSEEGRRRFAEMKRATARLYLEDLRKYRGRDGGRLLEVGCGPGDLLYEAMEAGFEVTGIEYNAAAVDRAREALGAGARVICGTLENSSLEAGQFDVCVLSDLLEHVRDPVTFLTGLRRVLAPDAVLLVTTPSKKSWSARLLKEKWMEFKPEHLFYFDPFTIQNILLRSGFDSIVVRPNSKVLTLDYIARHFERFSVPLWSGLVGLAKRVLPGSFLQRHFRVVPSGISVLARVTEVPQKKLLSIVIPAFNEAATIEPLLDRVLAKTIDGIDIELIIVESNSTDGTREVVERYAGHPRVSVLLENRPRGKGHAVRKGLAQARGAFVLIQDADLEYDVEDYDVLLEPLLENRTAFVLGARHGGKTWKMRQFEGQWLTCKVLNLGHWIFTMLVNVVFLLRLKDPFTMYKVFRRDCLYGLRFSRNRFDFDYELLVKLVRKGYRPIEIPVNYRSRSFAEGKKVSFLRDPFTWLLAIVKLRFERIDPLETIANSTAD